MSGAIGRLRQALLDVDVEPGVLRRDPRGHTWLEPSLREAIDGDPVCEEELAAFVEAELALFDGASMEADPFFTARIIDALPAVEPSGLSLRARTVVLAVFQILAFASAYAALWALAPDRLHGWIEALNGAVEQTPSVGLAFGIATLAVFAIAMRGFRPHTPPA